MQNANLERALKALTAKMELPELPEALDASLGEKGRQELFFQQGSKESDSQEKGME